MNEMVEKICPECGAAFMSHSGRALCCSDACKLNRNRRKTREWAYEHGYIRRRPQGELSPRQQTFASLRKRDAIAPKPRIEVVYRGGIIIERRGFIPAGAGAMRCANC